jgi:hypothetical protein
LVAAGRSAPSGSGSSGSSESRPIQAALMLGVVALINVAAAIVPLLDAYGCSPG